MKDHSKYQQGVIKRYYENREQIDKTRLGELVGNLYLASEKKAGRMWETAGEIMQRLEVPDSRIAHVLEKKDPAILAAVVEDLEAGRI